MDSRAIKSVLSLCDVNLTQHKISCPESHDFLSTLPTEMFRSILVRMQTLELIPLRLVSNRWKVVIESICSDKKCLVVMHHSNTYHLPELLKRFDLNELSKDSVVFKLKSHQLGSPSIKLNLSGHFCTLLAKLFSRLEQFFIIDDCTCSFNEFNSMLRQWSPSLTSLSVRLHHSEDVNDLCSHINQLTNLKKLNLDTLSVSSKQLAPTLARLTHLSGLGYESIDKIAPFLGENISGLGAIYRTVTIEELTNWHNLNAQSVLNLVRFSLYMPNPEIFPFICKHFSSLQMLRIDVCYFMLTPMIRQLAQLTHLTELFIKGNLINVASFDDSSLRPLRNIRILTLVDFTFVEDDDEEGQNVFDIYDLSENVHVRFMRFLSTIFPNVEQLTIKSAYLLRFGNLIEPHLNLFANLRSHDFGLNEPTIRLMDNGDQ